MKDKIVKEYHSKETGISVLTIQNKYGRFTGDSLCHPDDLEHYSEFTGLRYAEIRANMDYAKLRLNQEKIKLKTMENLLKDINYSERCRNEACPEVMRKIRLKIRDYTQSVDDWQNLYNHLRKAVKVEDETRTKIINRRTKKDNQEN